ncbi:hypothetical protein LFL96_21195 [Paraburkholderia sp. D15]|uniref:hypothetical protein n=1 Tax=Paraburkholderia sp. D15 TaxID=2880218 RepID=UPI00247A7F80|nr:hypothetical protein [Paraburkholderia sp. D15]WGS53576.1 hypothetical protein LFL96_21195 [Paraburkholderia sp. D15]
MSFIYPRTISITRPAQDTAVGYSSSYSGVQPSNETPVASDLPASIQLKKERGKPDPNLPADAAAKTFWTVFIPLGSAPLGLIRTNDIVTDDIGNRYQITGAYWNSLGYAALAELLEP